MLTHKKLKIWAIILHGLILIGAGHGAGPFFVFEIFGILNTKELAPVFSFSANDNRFGTPGLTALLGQAAIVGSLFIA